MIMPRQWSKGIIRVLWKKRNRIIAKIYRIGFDIFMNSDSYLAAVWPTFVLCIYSLHAVQLTKLFFWYISELCLFEASTALEYVGSRIEISIWCHSLKKAIPVNEWKGQLYSVDMRNIWSNGIWISSIFLLLFYFQQIWGLRFHAWLPHLLLNMNIAKESSHLIEPDTNKVKWQSWSEAEVL